MKSASSKIIIFLAATSALVFLSTCGTSNHSELEPAPIIQRAKLTPSRPNAQVVQYDQIIRQLYQEQFKIPRFPVYSDEFYQANPSSKKLDLLLVVDNSGSMGEEQANLSTKMNPLLSAIQDTDWRINVISTEWPCFEAPLPFDSSSSGLTSKFQNAISLGTSGSGYEKGMFMADLHLNRTEFTSKDFYSSYYGQTCTAGEWLRENSNLAILVVSDEDEDPSSTMTVEQFVTNLGELGYKTGENAKVYGIIWRPGDEECEDGYNEGVKYKHLILETGGIMGDICAEDYTIALTAISQDIRNLIRVQYTLRGKPILSTLELFIDENPFMGEFTLLGNVIILDNPLEQGQTLTVEYKTEEVRSLALKNSGDEESIQVFLDGNEVERRDYFYNADEKTLNFTSRIPDGSVVDVSYRENTSLRSEFPFPTVTPDTQIECYLEGEEFYFEYYADLNLIRFEEPHRDGKTVTCLYMAQNGAN